MCQEWKDSFETFLKDMGSRPSPGHSIDRIDNDGPYEHKNCRWATRKEQARHKTNSRWITFGGETLSVSEWAERAGVHVRTMRDRIFKSGWPIELALKTPSLQSVEERKEMAAHLAKLRGEST